MAKLFIEVSRKNNTMSMGEYELYYAYQMFGPLGSNLVAFSIEACSFGGDLY